MYLEIRVDCNNLNTQLDIHYFKCLPEYGLGILCSGFWPES